MTYGCEDRNDDESAKVARERGRERQRKRKKDRLSDNKIKTFREKYNNYDNDINIPYAVMLTTEYHFFLLFRVKSN